MNIALFLAFAVAFLMGWALNRALMPLFRAYALARPNGRSSHRVPVPQGGGLGILAGTLLGGLPIASMAGQSPPATETLALAAILIGLLGVWDDIRPLGWSVRLLGQALAVCAVLFALPETLRVLPGIPLVLERAMALVLGLWFVNLTNFMDGIDGILVLGLAPAALAIGTGFFGTVPEEPLAIALCGALLGFLVLNRPPARLFAGDIGALAVGLIGAYLLFLVAARHSLAAAIILPLYFVMDATSTLLMRAMRRENLARPHREHAYQAAFDRGQPIIRLLGSVLLLNLALSGLATLAILQPSVEIPCLLVAAGLTALLLVRQRRRGA